MISDENTTVREGLGLTVLLGLRRCWSNPLLSYVHRVRQEEFKALGNHPTCSQHLVKLRAQNGLFVRTEGFEVPWPRPQHCAAEQAVRPRGALTPAVREKPPWRGHLPSEHSVHAPPPPASPSRRLTCSPESHPLDSGQEPHGSLPLVPGKPPVCKSRSSKLKGVCL